MKAFLPASNTIIVFCILCLVPIIANEFWLVQIGAQTFVYAIIALGLTFLAGFGGMVSLAQVVVAGSASYSIAILGVNSEALGFGWNWFIVAILAVFIGTLFGTLIGVIATRTQGIYTIMITLAIATGFFYFTRQNYTIFNGFTGYAGIKAPIINGQNFREPIYFYYLALSIGVLCYVWIEGLTRSTFGIALQGIRDNARRMEALGFHVLKHRIFAYGIASILASIGGILMVWMNGRIDPSSIGVGVSIDILIISVIGGLSHPIGAFIGAFIFTILDNFAIDLISRERFNTVIGAFFLIIVLFSPDGILGWKRFLIKRRNKNEVNIKINDKV